MKNVSKQLAASLNTFIVEDGGIQCPSRVRINGEFVPVEEAVKPTKRNNMSLVVLFCCKQSLNKNVN